MATFFWLLSRRRLLIASVFLAICAASPRLLTAPVPAPASQAIALFDGNTLSGWQGDPHFWRVQDNAITGGSLKETIPQNEFLCTTREFTNFILRLRFKLSGTEGFVNSGIQIRSQRIPGSNEVSGYQCDLGDPNWWGAIYDEARRNRVLFPTDMIALDPFLKRHDWNHYVIRADGPRITTWINGIQTADYYEQEAGIPEHGVLGIQIHGGGKGLIQIDEITVEPLPPTRPEDRFVGAPDPAKASRPSPLSPEEQANTFTLPPGFEIELVASEIEGVHKPVTVVWDAAGRMWTMTATEYPVDAHDDPAVAASLYGKPGRDKVLVFENPYGPGPHTPQTFADGLAIPLGLLPYKHGAFVQHGADILFLNDPNQDGRADTREQILTGFGVGDSHLMPHQFTRAPGGWILVAQGAFNNSQVQTKSGQTITFNRTLLGRFSPDGEQFQTIGFGPCNIWGLVMNGQGQIFIQEANDYGYPVMPFHVGACYPGCTPFPKPYAPPFPGLSRTGMGGTGLSGLALSDSAGAFPNAYANVFYVANPITQRVQAVRLFRDGPYYELLKLPDFIRSSDEWFRPVAIHFGPDGCLYIVDWYNKVISHNEIARNHPDRDKSRGRIWRVRHRSQLPPTVTNLAKVPDEELVSFLGSSSLWHSHMAWQQIIDRSAHELLPDLRALALDKTRSPSARIQALWCLEALGGVDRELLQILMADPDRDLRRETTRVLEKPAIDESQILELVSAIADDPDPDVRAQVIRSAAALVPRQPKALELLVRMAPPALPGPLARSTQTGAPIKVREAYDHDFQRYLIRSSLEQWPDAVLKFLASDRGQQLPRESQLLAALALPPQPSARILARLLPSLDRPPNAEELIRLAEFPNEPEVNASLVKILADPKTRNEAAKMLVQGATRLDAAALRPVLDQVASALWDQDQAGRDIALDLARAFKLEHLQSKLVNVLRNEKIAPEEERKLIRALRDLNSKEIELFRNIASRTTDKGVQREAVLALASAPSAAAIKLLSDLWEHLSPAERHSALDQLASTRPGAEHMVDAVLQGSIPRADLETATIEKALTILGKTEKLEQLLQELGATVQSVLYLDGRLGSYVDSNIDLHGPFTVETWVSLAPDISNHDGILGRPGGADFNFAASRFRIYAGPTLGDRIIATRPITPNLWTHIAATRDHTGAFKIYINGELDTDECQPLTNSFTGLDIGRVTPNAGTHGRLAEFRVWNQCRSPEEIRAEFDRAFGSERPPHLVHYFPGAGPWGELNGKAKVVPTLDAPPVLTPAQAQAQAEMFAKFANLARRPGNPEHGKTVAALCTSCHAISGEGSALGPNLSGAGAMPLESLLRSILTPNAAMEAGYRIYRVELNSDELLDGFLVSQNADSIVLRFQGSPDQRIPRENIRRAYFLRRSLMPEGLLENLPEQDVIDLFAYLRTLK